VGVEWVIVGILSIFGFYQYDRANDYKDQAEDALILLRHNRDMLEATERINEVNSNVISNLEASNSNCLQFLEEQRSKVNQFRVIDQNNKRSVADIEKDLASTDFGSCIVPDGLDISK